MANVTTPSWAQPMDPLKEAQTYIQPMYDSARRDLGTWMANKGLTNSSVGANHYGAMASDMANKQSLMAQELYRNNRDFAEQRRQWGLNQQMLQNQFGAEMGLKIMDMLSARELQKWGMAEIPKGMRLPKDPGWFKNFKNMNYQPINFNTSGPTGDPTEQWERYSPKPWKSTGLKLQESADSRAASSASLQAELARNADRRAAEKHRKEMNGTGSSTASAEETAFSRALWELIWTPIIDPQTKLPALDANGNKIYQNDYAEIRAFAEANGRDIAKYTNILRPDLMADHNGQYPEAAMYGASHAPTPTYMPTQQQQQPFDWSRLLPRFNEGFFGLPSPFPTKRNI